MKESPPRPSSPNHLETCTNLVTTLLTDHIPSTHHFKSKWSQIRTKLLTLQTNLKSLSPSPTPSPSPLLTSVLTSLSTTLTSLTTLSSTCSHPNLPAGKLLTQSNLLSLSTLLDSHLHSLSLIPDYDPDSTLSPPLLTLLQIGSPDSKLSALSSLLTSKDISVISSSIPSLISLLDSPISDLREKSAVVISTITTKHLTSLNDTLPLITHMSRLLDAPSTSPFIKQHALLSLSSLTTTKDNARAFSSRGGVSSLLELSLSGTPSTAALSAQVLTNLAQYDDLKETFLEENAVPVLLSLSSSGTPLARENSMACLATLAFNDETIKVVIVREGGVEALVSYWDSTHVGPPLLAAVNLLTNLASYYPFLEMVVGYGFGSRMLPLLNCEVLSVRMAAAEAVYELGGSSRARKEMGECGCVTALVRMLDGKAAEERESGAKALSRLVECGVNKKVFKKDERGVVSIVQMLDPLSKNSEKKWPVAVLLAVSQSKKCRKKMVAGGATVFLEKLVELEVEGAKKLLDCLGKSKLWGVFSRP